MWAVEDFAKDLGGIIPKDMTIKVKKFDASKYPKVKNMFCTKRAGSLRGGGDPA